MNLEMNSDLWRGIAWLLAGVVLPIGYLAILKALKRADAPSPPRFEFFTAFGTLGGWLLTVSLSPSPLCLLLAAFTMFIAMPTALVLLVRITWRLQLSRFHVAAMGALVAGLGIPVLVTFVAASMASAT